MAAKKSTGANGSAGQGKGGAMLPLVLLTLVAAGAGAAHGFQMFNVFQTSAQQNPAGSNDVAAPAAAGHGAPAKAEGGHGAPAVGGHGAAAPAAASAAAVKLPSKIVIRDLPPVVTNVAMPADSWLRLESSIVYY